MGKLPCYTVKRNWLNIQVFWQGNLLEDVNNFSQKVFPEKTIQHLWSSKGAALTMTKWSIWWQDKKVWEIVKLLSNEQMLWEKLITWHNFAQSNFISWPSGKNSKTATKISLICYCAQAFPRHYFAIVDRKLLLCYELSHVFLW